MIDVNFQCDFGPEKTTGVSTVLPAGWLYAELRITGSPRIYLCCPLHQNLAVVVADAPPAPTESSISKPVLTAGNAPK